MKRQSVRPKMLELQLLQHQLLRHQCHVLVTTHLVQVVQFHVHLVQETIHFQLVAQFRVHHNARKAQAHRAQEWRDHDQVQCDQVLLHVQVHLVLQVEVDLLHVQVAHQVALHTNQIHQEPVQLLAVHNVQVVVVHHNAVVRVEHLVRMQARNQVVNKSHVRRYAMSSTICRHHNLVAQLVLTVME